MIECLTKGDKLALAEITGTMTLEKSTAGTKLDRLKIVMGYQNLLKTLMLLIYDILSDFNFPADKTMSESQVISAAQGLISEYKIFSLEDFALCFNKGKMGKYGKNYGKFDKQDLFDWVRKYDEERDEYFVHKNKQVESKEPLLPKDMKEVYEKTKNSEPFKTGEEILKEKQKTDHKKDIQYQQEKQKWLANKPDQEQLKNDIEGINDKRK